MNAQTLQLRVLGMQIYDVPTRFRVCEECITVEVATLLAAAPEMLRALKARAEIRRKGMMYCSPQELREALDLERDAIAKATGQVPA